MNNPWRSQSRSRCQPAPCQFPSRGRPRRDRNRCSTDDPRRRNARSAANSHRPAERHRRLRAYDARCLRLRERFPQAHIAWVVEEAAAPLVKAVGAVDHVIVVPKRFVRSMRSVAKLRSELQSERFDLTLDPQGLTKSGFAAWLSAAPRRIGFGRPHSREISPWLQTELVESHATHVVDHYLELLKPLGIESPTAHFGLSIPDAARKRQKSWPPCRSIWAASSS